MLDLTCAILFIELCGKTIMTCKKTNLAIIIEFLFFFSFLFKINYYSPASKKGAKLDLGCLSFRPLIRQNHVSAQYLENQSIEFDQILYMH